MPQQHAECCQYDVVPVISDANGPAISVALSSHMLQFRKQTVDFLLDQCDAIYRSVPHTQ